MLCHFLEGYLTYIRYALCVEHITLQLENLIGDTVTHVTVDNITSICIQAACGQALGCAGGSKDVWPVGFVWAGTQGRTVTTHLVQTVGLNFRSSSSEIWKSEIGNWKSEIGNRKSEIGKDYLN